MKSSFLVKLLLGFLAVLLIAFGGTKLMTPQEKSIDKLERNDRLSLKKNIIVLGVDERKEDYDVGRSDTLFVVMLDTSKKNASLLSVPRDTRVKIQNHGWDKINHAYAYGGRELTQQTVEEFLGLRIDNYVMVDFNGFTGLVDAIGGVDINVEKDMYYRDSWDGFTIDLKKGLQHMDGKTAIQYVRYRDEDGDIGRIGRQQKFLMAVHQKISSANMLLNVPGLTKQLNSMVKTNLPLTDMVDLGRALHSMVKEGGLVMATVPGEGEYIDEISYWIPNVREMRKMMVDMQGGVMNERFRTAADIMAAEYDAAIAKAKKGDDSEENKEALKKEKEAAKKDKEEQEANLTEQEKAVREKTGQLKSNLKNKQRKADKDGGKLAKESNKGADKSKEVTVSKAPVRSAVTVRVVNCSGNPNAMAVAISRLHGAGFRVINGGTGGEVIANTLVTSTTGNGTVVNKLSAVPFGHSLRIARDGAADCDGVILLGRDFQ